MKVAASLLARARGARVVRMLALALLGVLSFASASSAQVSEVVLRWIPQDDTATGYRAYFALPGASFRVAVELGAVDLDEHGIATAVVPISQVEVAMGALSSTGTAEAAVTAYNGAGESFPSNRVLVTINAHNPDPKPTLAPPMFFDDFESIGAGEEPGGWVDTVSGEDFPVETPEAFETTTIGDTVVFGTNNEVGDVHSHFTGGFSEDWTDYEFRGRMQISSANAAIGVTVFSEMPDAERFYRLAYDGDGGNFSLANQLDVRDDSECVGDIDSGVSPALSTWYRFRFQAYAFQGGTQLRAKVWAQNGPEPTSWQISCVHAGDYLLDSGRPGLWSSRRGSKYWDDLEVIPLEASQEGGSDLPIAGGEPRLLPLPDSVMDFEDLGLGTVPDGWMDTAPGNSLDEVTGLFRVLEVGPVDARERVFGTMSRSPDVHSHLVGLDEELAFNYEFRGRMQVSIISVGVGVTVYSDYPNSDSYYRLRALPRDSFRLSSHPEGKQIECMGVSDTGVALESMTWFEFRFQAFDASDGTRLRAKIWRQDKGEPSLWQIDCIDRADGGFAGGVPGLWATGRGQKYWDDLQVIPLQLP